MTLFFQLNFIKIFLYLIEQRKIVDTVLMGEANNYHIDVSDIEPRVSEKCISVTRFIGIL